MCVYICSKTLPIQIYLYIYIYICLHICLHICCKMHVYSYLVYITTLLKGKVSSPIILNPLSTILFLSVCQIFIALFELVDWHFEQWDNVAVDNYNSLTWLFMVINGLCHLDSDEIGDTVCNQIILQSKK